MIAAYEAYALLFWPLMLGFIVAGAWQRRGSLMRCVTVLAGGQLAIEMIGAMPQQPWPAYLAIYAASAALVSVRPSGKLCSIMAGLFIAGVVFSVIRGLSNWTDTTDWLYWETNLMLGWLSLIVLAGASTGDSGKRIVARWWRGIVGVVIPSRNRGLAR